MLYATGFDAEGELYPLAFGVVEEETKESWGWFVSELRKFLASGADSRLTILSSRQTMIVRSRKSVFPESFPWFLHPPTDGVL